MLDASRSGFLATTSQESTFALITKSEKDTDKERPEAFSAVDVFVSPSFRPHEYTYVV